MGISTYIWSNEHITNMICSSDEICLSVGYGDFNDLNICACPYVCV